jgi:hypothetical protein
MFPLGVHRTWLSPRGVNRRIKIYTKTRTFLNLLVAVYIAESR